MRRWTARARTAAAGGCRELTRCICVQRERPDVYGTVRCGTLRCCADEACSPPVRAFHLFRRCADCICACRTRRLTKAVRTSRKRSARRDLGPPPERKGAFAGCTFSGEQLRAALTPTHRSRRLRAPRSFAAMLLSCPESDLDPSPELHRTGVAVTRLRVPFRTLGWSQARLWGPRVLCCLSACRHRVPDCRGRPSGWKDEPSIRTASPCGEQFSAAFPAARGIGPCCASTASVRKGAYSAAHEELPSLPTRPP